MHRIIVLQVCCEMIKKGMNDSFSKLSLIEDTQRRCRLKSWNFLEEMPIIMWDISSDACK